MTAYNYFSFNVRAIVCALMIMALLGALSVPAARAQNNHQHDMHGMDMSQPKPKPVSQKKKKPAPKKDEMQGMDMKGMEMTGTPSPSPAPSSTPAAPVDNAGTNDTNAAQTPANSATPQPAASTDTMNPNMQMSPAVQTPVTDALKPDQDKAGGMANVPLKDSGNNSMQGMSGAGNMSGMNSMNMGSLMVMSGNDMGIRVGSSQTNIMPMGQMGSGTAWEPAATRMNMYHRLAGDWLLMFHFNLIAGVNSQGGLRGSTKFESQNWFMPMAYHKLGRGTLQLRGMFAAEPFTYARGGSPLLFQTGEAYKGEPLVDKQHPHDLFMELSAQYTMALGERATWFTYFGYPGEPALGPVAFMHRASASENPAAPLSHHLQDSTHVSFGVLTTGFTFNKFKLEGSIFNGHEPDEHRYNFEAGKWNSRSARLSYAPNKNWSIQISHGFLKKPEELEAGDQRRTTASIQYNRAFNRGGIATSLIWGRNHLSNAGETANLNGYTAESTVNFLDKNYAYTRLELVDKNELLRPEDKTRLGFNVDDHPNFRIGAYTFGYDRDIVNTKKFSMAVGSDVTLYSMPSALNQLYGNNPAVLQSLFPYSSEQNEHGEYAHECSRNRQR